MTYVDLANNVDISVTTHYISEQSDPETHRYVFSYHITISNHNDVAVQLISRRWLITDGNEQTQEVVGEGVVGEQPVIAPGESYSYTSGTVMATEVGSMQGHYDMVRVDDGEEFKASIPPFTLAQTHALH
ncbi:MAG TPA: Co2+/Mg2+ efflux protein ApaG [Marinobacterium sp.]|nr:Co2+/Mg2+ efflux protein ApaG [Marinobacterium sp.]